MDRRTKRQKLQAMANQSVSPHEAEIARKLLAEMGPEPVQGPAHSFYAVTYDEMVERYYNDLFNEIFKRRMTNKGRVYTAGSGIRDDFYYRFTASTPKNE